MAQGAHANPEHMRHFANELSAFTQLLSEETNHMQARLAQLHDSWDDQGFDHFAECFKETQVLLNQFCEEVKKAVPAIRADAERLENYLKITLNR